MRSQSRVIATLLPAVLAWPCRGTWSRLSAGARGWLVALACGVVASLWSLSPALHVWTSECGTTIIAHAAHHECSQHAHDGHDHARDEHHDHDAPSHDERHPCSICDLILATTTLGGTLDAPAHADFAALVMGMLRLDQHDHDGRRLVAGHARGPPTRA